MFKSIKINVTIITGSFKSKSIKKSEFFNLFRCKEYSLEVNLHFSKVMLLSCVVKLHFTIAILHWHDVNLLS